MKKLNIVYQDKNLLVINKPAGILVHETSKKEKETLVNLVLERFPQMGQKRWSDLSRAGIVHRLDRDTTGLLIMAQNPQTLSRMQAQLRKRQVRKKYLCLVKGRITPRKDIIVASIGRKRGQAKMTTMVGRSAQTQYAVIDYYQGKEGDIYSFLDVQIVSGRTHQIRVHFKSRGYPVVGDQVYARGKEKKLWQKLGLHRQFLHAYFLEFFYPENHQKLKFQIDLPADLKMILAKLVRIS